MTLAARHRHWPVLLGAATAFLVLNALAVVFGASVAAWVSERVIAGIVALLTRALIVTPAKTEHFAQLQFYEKQRLIVAPQRSDAGYRQCPEETAIARMILTCSGNGAASQCMILEQL